MLFDEPPDHLGVRSRRELLARPRSACPDGFIGANRLTAGGSPNLWVEETVSIAQVPGMDLGMKKTLPLSWEAALEAVPAALKTEGFGVLTKIDVQATLKEKIGVDFRRYTILGACNPNFAHRALSQRLDVGLLLPCNVVLHEADDKKSVELMVIDPLQTMASMLGGSFVALTTEVREKLAKGVAQLPG